MQGHNSSLITFTENLNFDPSATSSDADIEGPRVSWSVMQTTGENRAPEFGTSSSGETNVRFMNHQQSIGEASSSAGPSQRDCVERKREHSWSVHSQAHHYDLSDNLPFDSVHLSSNGDQISSGPSLPLFSSSEALAFSRDLNICLNEDAEDDNDAEDDDDDVRVIARPEGYTPSVSLHGLTDPNDEDRPGSSLDVRRLSCKRKTVEAGPSSEAGNSNLYHDNERTQWDSSVYPQIIAANVNTSTQPREANPRLRLGIEGPMSSSPLSLTPSGTFESSWRSFRLRVNDSNQQDHTPQISDTDVLDLHAPSSSSRHAARFYLHHCLFGPNQDAAALENRNSHGQSVFSRVPLAHRNSHSRWSGASSSRAHSSDTDNEDPITSEIIPRSVTCQSMLNLCNETGSSSSSEQPTNGISASGSNSNIRNVRTTSRSGSNRTSPMYHRRLSELVRRSRLSSAGTESNSSNVGRQAPTSLQETPLLSGSSSRRHHTPSSRSSFSERNLENVFGLPHSSRSLGSSGEGRSSVMSEEIRHVLDLMRRGEGLRFEDVMLLEHSIFFNMANTNDRHRDMRMDVDNMTYEELLALGERIGNVCTGLKEETISKYLKQSKHVEAQPKDAETEPCCICREEYTQGENIGKLDCGHDFHSDCIKQWLMQKNLCPICKTTGLTMKK